MTQLQKNYSKDLEHYEFPLEKIEDSEFMELCLNGDIGSCELLTKKTFNHAAMLRLIHLFLSQVTLKFWLRRYFCWLTLFLLIKIGHR